MQIETRGMYIFGLVMLVFWAILGAFNVWAAYLNISIGSAFGFLSAALVIWCGWNVFKNWKETSEYRVRRAQGEVVS